MTVSTTTRKVTYTGNASNTTFAFTFPVNSSDDIEVYLAGVKQTSGYSVSLSTNKTGSVVFTSAPASGVEVFIRRVTTLTQTTDYAENDSFPAEVHETAIDKAMMAHQDVKEDVARSLKFAVNSDYTNYEMPDPEAGKVFGWDEAGTGITNYSNSITAAQASAAAAAASASSASNSATNASNSASAASTSEINAASYATTASGNAATATAAVAGGFRGYIDRPVFTWTSTSGITIGQGIYYHYGTTEQKVTISSPINITETGLAADTWYYIYIDDSEISGQTITISQITVASGIPTESFTKAGYYNGNDMAIFMFLTDGSGNIIEFLHTGLNYVQYADSFADSGGLADYDTSGTNETLTIPSICREAQVTIYTDPRGDTNTTKIYWKTTGQTGTSGHYIGEVNQNQGALSIHSPIRVITNTSQQITIFADANNDAGGGVETNGFYLPKYM